MVKKKFRDLCKVYHPDLNPTGTIMMQMLNDAYGSLMESTFPIMLESLEGEFNFYGEEIEKALHSIVNLEGVIVEVCGSWVWISGKTRKFKETLLNENFLWASKKKMWYFRPKDQVKRHYRSSLSIDDIRKS